MGGNRKGFSCFAQIQVLCKVERSYTLILKISKILGRLIRLKTKSHVDTKGTSMRRVTSTVSKINAVEKNNFSSQNMKKRSKFKKTLQVLYEL